jgi:hypothetical protein
VGITSAAVDAARAAGQPRAIGWKVDDAGALVVRAAAPGDTDLDGRVDLLDVAMVLAAGRFDGGSAAWSEGDFNADGGFDILDAGELVGADVYDRGPYEMATAGSVAAVPEPALATVAAMSAAWMLINARWRSRFRASGT